MKTNQVGLCANFVAYYFIYYYSILALVMTVPSERKYVGRA